MATNDTRRKVLAVLAGGVVLGVGVGVTLAAWNDSEFATGTFTAGSFNLEGSTTSATADYADHNVDDGDAAASLVFQLPEVAASMSPGDVVYAPFWVRLDSTTTNDATLIPAGITAGSGGNEPHLSYTVTAIDPGDACDATATGTVVASGATLSAQTGATSVPLAQGATAGTPGTPVQLCFAVTAGAGLEQGETAVATWEFTATSIDN
ncbi:SipW-dependent-type signal peptide-containing protein [Microbacterium sp. UFMG61]|jgi:predicted ribosomally synthesized peptide with SipW-like signal peptide|uniref:SipW-dependent-type signal peptide-containing protein n=1 Tax=Microbacterium sp. UFMG61 TaxID=2745935 RepID=UPI00188EF4F7|nr:SipW-dependent-type signal peptide-containing protein [Microbacterium sp. UFMG61]